jgi:protein-S-isoprenylcysteine O-methyltransferase Ste14
MSKIVYGIGFLIFLIVRKYYEYRNRKGLSVLKGAGILAITFLFIVGIGMVVPLVYIFSQVMDFANYSRPEWIMWIGVVLLFVATIMLWRSHSDLGRHWTPTPTILEKHKLVTEGIYKHIRHPIYSAHFVWAIGQILVLPNWIAGLSFIITMTPLYLHRVGKEEKMMINEFGDDYKKYMKRTGRLFPKF